MVINQLLELSMILDADHFQRLFNAKASYLKELDEEYSGATQGGFSEFIHNTITNLFK